MLRFVVDALVNFVDGRDRREFDNDETISQVFESFIPFVNLNEVNSILMEKGRGDIVHRLMEVEITSHKDLDMLAMIQMEKNHWERNNSLNRY